MKRNKQPRNSKGRFVKSIKPQQQVYLLQDHTVSIEKMGVHTLEESERFMKKWGGSYIIQPLNS